MFSIENARTMRAEHCKNAKINKKPTSRGWSDDIPAVFLRANFNLRSPLFPGLGKIGCA